MRRLKSRRSGKTRSGGRRTGNDAVKAGGRKLSTRTGRRLNPQGQSLGNEPRMKPSIKGGGIDESAENRKYGFEEPKVSGGRNQGQKAGQRRRPVSEVTDIEEGARGEEQSMDIPERRKETEPEQGRPDQLSTDEDEDLERQRGDETRGASPANPTRAAEAESVEDAEEVDEGDQEGRGGAINPANDEDVIDPRRKAGRPGRPRTHRPE